ncbi:glycerate kinase [Gloeocapsopsis crepidinum LEGE 06123]|uniref:Glycerate kinase n=1 Tax=Gloeocapsopsis crepidinum LEGE 06123 TaxID=588587 RepID=A0ABR9UP12_9CHRO|nr:glycerate kinase [Gloeocapsopsis crepidinum]MBE9189355.1 glycerate kinase [Gloeocapsopsis crepidinum LEGE 06123]
MRTANLWLSQILANAVLPDERIAQAMLADPLRAQAFDITSKNVAQVVQKRSHLLRAVYPAFSDFCQARLYSPNQLIDTLWDFWLPLAMQLAASRQQLQRTLIQGILGGQGTGKTTLSAILTLILDRLGYRTVSLSLDDLYKTYHERLALRQHDPRLIWRGPPGTHDVDLGLTILQKLRQPNSQPIAIPRFDKSAYSGAGDRTQPEIIEAVDIVLFEGWFVGVRPIDPQQFNLAPPPIDTHADREFARDMNARLHEYLPLWEQLDSLILLYPEDYRRSLTWRKDAEHDQIAAGQAGMIDAEVENFVKYFWRSLHPELFIKPLLTPPTWVDLVVEIDPDHSPRRVYRPGDLASYRRGQGDGEL